MPTIISFVNQKGGVGKTTSSINTARALCLHKKKVLIIDMDPQANSTQVLTSTSDNDTSIYNLLLHNKSPKKTSFDDVIQSTYVSNLDILPSNVLLSSAEIDLVNEHARETVLKRCLKEHTKELNKYDFVIIDCQPSLGLLTINSIIASHYLMVPIHADVFSLTGLELLTQTITKLQDVFEINTTILGFFFTQVSEKATLFKEAHQLCKFTYPELLSDTYIRSNTVIDQANATDQSVIDFSPNSTSSKDYKKLAKEILEKCKQ